jgi:hypothetical protein
VVWITTGITAVLAVAAFVILNDYSAYTCQAIIEGSGDVIKFREAWNPGFQGWYGKKLAL